MHLKSIIKAIIAKYYILNGILVFFFEKRKKTRL